jgi:hypothetical protein
MPSFVVRGTLPEGHAAQRVIHGGRRAVVGQVAGGIVGEADVGDLVGGVERLRDGAGAVQPDAGAVAGAVVGVGEGGAGGLGGGGQALEAVVGVGDRTRSE